MDARRTVDEFVTKGKDLHYLLRSPAGEMLSYADLQTLRIQLHLLDTEAINLQNLKQHRLKATNPPAADSLSERPARG